MDSPRSEQDIQIVDEVLGQMSHVSDDMQPRITVRNILTSLLYLQHDYADHLHLIVGWLIRVTTPEIVIHATLEDAEYITPSICSNLATIRTRWCMLYLMRSPRGVWRQMISWKRSCF